MKKMLKIKTDFFIGKSIFLSMLFMVIAMISIGCSQSAGNSALTKKVTINFDDTKMTCKKGFDGPSINSGEKINEQTELYFEAINLGGNAVDKWTVNDKNSSEYYIGKTYFYYTVDTADGNTVTIDYTTK